MRLSPVLLLSPAGPGRPLAQGGGGGGGGVGGQRSFLPAFRAPMPDVFPVRGVRTVYRNSVLSLVLIEGDTAAYILETVQ